MTIFVQVDIYSRSEFPVPLLPLDSSNPNYRFPTGEPVFGFYQNAWAIQPTENKAKQPVEDEARQRVKDKSRPPAEEEAKQPVNDEARQPADNEAKPPV